jgi:two-component system sensor histidine kinase FlrB
VVDDDGPGIPPALLGRVFEPFFTTRTQGSGLGLAVAKQVVEAHGGEIEATCPNPEGTRVTILLPARRGRSKEAAFASGNRGRDEHD